MYTTPLFSSSAGRWFRAARRRARCRLASLHRCFRHARLDENRPAKLSRRPSRRRARAAAADSWSCCPTLFRLRHDVQRAAGGIDDRRAGNADFRRDVTALAGFAGWDRRNASPRIDEADAPQRRRAAAVRVEGVDRVVLRRDVDHVVHALPRDRDVRHVQGRGV